MENVRKYFEYLEENKEEGFHRVYNPLIEELVENIFNKTLHLSVDDRKIYARAITEKILICIENGINSYMNDNKNLMLINLNYLEIMNFPRWLNGNMGGLSFSERHKDDPVNKEVKSTYGSNRVDDIYENAYSEYLEWLEDSEHDGYWKIMTLKTDQQGNRYNPHNRDYIIAVNPDDDEMDEVFDSYVMGMISFFYEVDHVMDQFDINVYEFIIGFDGSGSIALDLFSIDQVKESIKSEELPRRHLKQKSFKSSMTQKQLSTMFRLLSEKGIISASDTDIAILINQIAGGSIQRTRSYLGGENAEHINMTLSSKEQAEEIQSILRSIIDKIEEEKKGIITD